MTHLQLIKLLSEYKDVIDLAYRSDEYSVDIVPQVLVDNMMFIKIGDKYKLNQNYILWVNSILDRVDYSIILGDYEKEHKELIKLKSRYISTNREHYKDEIISVIERIYMEFVYRDKSIASLLKKIENESSLEIDLLIEKANDILEMIGDLVEANLKLESSFIELQELHQDIKLKMMSINTQMYHLFQNISVYIDTLNSFIIQTKDKRRENQRLFKVANDILNEDDIYLDDKLMLYGSEAYYTLKYMRNSKVSTVIDVDSNIGSYLRDALSQLSLERVKKERADRVLPKLKVEPLDLIDIEEIIASLNQNGCDDLFIYLYGLDCIADKQEAFKVYLQLLTDEHIVYSEEFNQYNIKVIRWII